jgi:D-alanine-D-alanine ligase
MSVLQTYKIWVLAPLVESDDPNIQFYYDFTQSIAEYSRVFEQLGLQWQWQPVTMQNYVAVLQQIAESANGLQPLVLNLCDGDEVNGAPGISVIHELNRLGLTYTGSDVFFYDITTSKIPMKTAFDRVGVPNGAWEVIPHNCNGVEGIFERIGTPILIKPAVSGGSMGLAITNVVHTDEQLKHRVAELNDGYHGWQLTTDGLIAEHFIAGREFTSFVVGSSEERLIVYEPIERVFHHSLPETEQFLSFDRLWETYDDESPMPDNGYVYEYKPVPAEIVPAIKEMTKAAYLAVGGVGYGRLDFRMDKEGRLFVLEVNAQCGLSEDEDYTSIGAILKVSQKTFTQLVTEVLHDALQRHVVVKKKKLYA